MTDLETELRGRLATAAQAVDVRPDFTADVVAAGRRRIRRRNAIAVAGAAAAVTAVVGAAVLAAGGTSTTAPVGPGPTPPRAAKPGPRLPPTAMSVGAPLLSASSGPIPVRRPLCHQRDVRAVGRLRSVPGGVVGAVVIRGHDCSLQPAFPVGLSFVDAAGRPLHLPVQSYQPAVNPPENPRPDLVLAAGQVTWGFAWRGPWCGGTPAAVVLGNGGHAPEGRASTANPIRVPLTGPVPPCAGTSDGVVVPGVVGGLANGTLPPPAAWSGLRVKLRLPGSESRHRIQGMQVLVENTTSQAISLDPCPSYTVVVISHSTGGGIEYDTSSGRLGCTEPPLTVPPHETRTVALPDREYGSLPHRPQSGTRVRLSFAIAGVPTASGTTRVR
jgi:hypothetical protein